VRWFIFFHLRRSGRAAADRLAARPLDWTRVMRTRRGQCIQTIGGDSPGAGLNHLRLMTPTTDLGVSIRLSVFELRETGDLTPPPEPARAETGGDDQLVLKRRECPWFAILNQ